MSPRPEVRRLTEAREQSLSPYAQQSSLSRGRLREEEPCPIRTAFQRDRDRILHCNSFRRLKHKTQVFIAPLGDHYVTRLTHTLEVSQIARTIARALNLNEDLVEAISLGHDLGHTPFGHIGEEVLNQLYPGGFHHNEQSLRVVDSLENKGQGLNLTLEVRDGILKHSKTRASLLGGDWKTADTLEGKVCRLADIVAYVNHDTDDAIRAGVLTEGDLPLSAIRVLGLSRSARINAMVTDIIDFSWSARGGTDDATIGMSSVILEATSTLRDFLFERVYDVQSAGQESVRAREVLRRLYDYLSRHEEKLPRDYRLPVEDRERGVVDYIAGMTDRYALRIAEELSLLDEKVTQSRFPLD